MTVQHRSMNEKIFKQIILLVIFTEKHHIIYAKFQTETF